MSLTVVLRETALRSLARIRGEDKDLFTRTRRAISALAGTSPVILALAEGTWAGLTGRTVRL